MVAAAGLRLRRTWPQRFLITFNCVLVVVCLTGAGALGWFYYRFGQLPTIDLDQILNPEDEPGEPQNFLLVGSDSRAFVEGGQDAESFGDQSMVSGQRADTVIVVRIDPRNKRAAMLSFPRDLWVDIPGMGKGRINSSFQEGPELLIRTLQENFDIPIHHYAQVDFAGFRALVDKVGGVEIFLPSPVRDRQTGLDIQQTGCVELDGTQALAYVRSRHFQYMEGGRWRSDPRGDLGRIERQQDFIRRALREAISRDLLDPRKLNSLIDVAIDNVVVDKGLDARDIVSLGRRFRSLSPDMIEQFQLPVRSVSRGGASVVVISDEAAADEIFERFRPEPATPGDIPPSSVRVRVLNGSGRAGEASAANAALQAAGFVVTAPGDGQFGTETTTIRFGPGQRAKAALLARYIAADVRFEEAPGLVVDLELVTGLDWRGLLDEPRPVDPSAPAGDAATTTAPPPPPPPPDATPPPDGEVPPPEPEC